MTEKRTDRPHERFSSQNRTQTSRNNDRPSSQGQRYQSPRPFKPVQRIIRIKSARRAALDILMEVQKGGYSNLCLNKELQEGEYQEIDKRFITELVYGTLEKQIKIDFILSQFYKQPPQGIIVEILRMGTYQIIFLDRVPDSAACDQSVILARAVGEESSTGLVNAILRKVSARKDEIVFPDEHLAPIDFLSVEYSYPKYLLGRYIDAYGFEETKQMVSTLETKTTCIRPNLSRISRDDFTAYLNKQGIEFEHGKICEDAYYVNDLGNVYAQETFREGKMTVQSEASMLAVRCLDPKPDENILDACSAPGGKAAYMAEITGGQANIQAWDIHEHRVKLIEETLARLGEEGVVVSVADASLYKESMRGMMNGVLVDAPCTGTGVIGNKPEIRYRINSSAIRAMQETQATILRVCSRYVKPGGRLVYSTCSVLPEENGEMIQKFLKKNIQFIPGDIKKYLPQALHERVQDGGIQLFPHRDGTDGFYVALLERRKV